jgi:hypothetical protein
MTPLGILFLAMVGLTIVAVMGLVPWFAPVIVAGFWLFGSFAAGWTAR